MNRQRIVLIIGGVAVIVVLVALTLYGLRLNQPDSKNGTQYTDSISGQRLTAFGADTGQHENGESAAPLTNQITITGLDDFMTDITQDQAQSILTDLTTFIRARVGARGTRAGALDAKITTVSDNPKTYTFVLVVVSPASRYDVTVTMPASTTTTPQLTFGGVTQ